MSVVKKGNKSIFEEVLIPLDSGGIVVLASSLCVIMKERVFLLKEVKDGISRRFKKG